MEEELAKPDTNRQYDDLPPVKEPPKLITKETAQAYLSLMFAAQKRWVQKHWRDRRFNVRLTEQAELQIEITPALSLNQGSRVKKYITRYYKANPPVAVQ